VTTALHPTASHAVTAVHRLPTEVKIVAATAFVFAVVATPREAVGAFALHFTVVVAICILAEIRWAWLIPRMSIEVPFVALAVLLPFAEAGARIDVLGLSLSVPGLYAAWGIVVKGTLGVLVSLVLAATTPVRDLPTGLARLRVPALITTVIVLMLRYVELLASEARRMDIARLSRGGDPRTILRIGATARGVGELFVRAYERGERVHLAMLSRGFTGTLPTFGARASGATWLAALFPAVLGAAICAAAWTVG